jgi:hypothetical protein
MPPHNFVRPPCWYYRLQEIEKHDFRADPYGITSILNFIQIHPAVLKLNHADRRTDRQTHFTHILQITYDNIKKSVHTAKKTQRVSILQPTWLMLFREIMAGYSQNLTKPITTLCGQNVELLIIIACNTYSYHWTLKNRYIFCQLHGFILRGWFYHRVTFQRMF